LPSGITREKELALVKGRTQRLFEAVPDGYSGGGAVVNRKVQLAFGAAIFTLLAMGALSYRSVVLSSESNRWVRHTREVLENLQNLVSDMTSIESSARGFVLTGEESYIESYRVSILDAKKDEAAVRNLTVDNLNQQRQISVFEELMTQKIRFGDSMSSLRRAKGLGAADVKATAEVRDEFRSVVRTMQDEELRLLALRDADSSKRFAQTKISLMGGTILAVIIAVGAGRTVRRDSAARDLAEEALRESQKSFSTLANNISQLAWMADEKGYIFWYNDRWFEYTGTTLEEMRGWGWQKVHHPDHVERVVAKIARCFQTGEIWEDTFPLRGRDGNYRLFLSRAVPVRDPKGGVLRWFGTNTDISEGTESGARYRGLLEAAPDAMVVVNHAGEIVLLNVQAEKRFGYSRDELVGQKVKNIIPEGFAERLIADGTRSAAEALGQQIGTGIELLGRRKNGSEFPIEIMLSPLESTDGILVTAAIRDISVRKKSDDHLAKTVGELKRSNDELQQFAYVSSHDLQEPLRMVSSYTQLLAKRYKGRLDSDADEFIAFAVDGCKRMQGLIQDLLAYSRAGTNGNALREISGEDALKVALTNLRAAVEQSGAVVTHDSLPAITTDETQLTQIFQNLVGNAIKYRRAESPQVHVSASKNGGNEWIFSVRDNGLGIDPQYFERIFILFQRLHGREDFEGTGIGLAICKKIVERLGGRIWVESQPEKGSTFYFALPEMEGR
jgi:PAS domain S-box-containing protein